jgi:hypothetical protein
LMQKKVIQRISKNKHLLGLITLSYINEVTTIQHNIMKRYNAGQLLDCPHNLWLSKNTIVTLMWKYVIWLYIYIYIYIYKVMIEWMCNSKQTMPFFKWHPKYGWNFILHIDVRYIFPFEATWCLFHFWLHQEYPNIIRLAMELPNW